MLTITPGPVTVRGQPVPVTGGPWRLGPPAGVRIATVLGFPVGAMYSWTGTAWQAQQ